MNGRILLIPLLLAVAPGVARAEAERARTHTVYEGQRLGSIAKRYNVTIEALSRANNMRRTDTIRPGQRLRIPSPDDTDGSATRDAAEHAERATRPRPASDKQGALARSHRVESGQRLESIARRYGVSVDALCSVNGIDSQTVIRPGQSLSIPAPGAMRRADAPASARDSFRAYFRSPKIKGKVDLASYTQRFTGRVFDSKGRMLAAARSGLARVLATSGQRPDADARLVRLLVAVSDKFGGRPIRIVSGFRKASYFEDSKHKSSRAVDFSIHGVPNEALRDYLRTLPNVGVGYYPNSSFVHLDVREYAAYWVDHAGPGEAPRSSAIARRKAVDVHEVEPSDVIASSTTREKHEVSGPDRGQLPATGTSALSGFESDAFGATRPLRDKAPPFALPKARPTLDPP